MYMCMLIYHVGTVHVSVKFEYPHSDMFNRFQVSYIQCPDLRYTFCILSKYGQISALSSFWSKPVVSLEPRAQAIDFTELMMVFKMKRIKAKIMPYLPCLVISAIFVISRHVYSCVIHFSVLCHAQANQYMYWLHCTQKTTVNSADYIMHYRSCDLPPNYVIFGPRAK